MKSPECLYLENEKLMMSVAWRFVDSSGIPFDDILSEFKIIFFDVYQNYKPEKGKFSTVLHTSIYNRGLNLLLRQTALKRKNEVRLDSDSIPETVQTYNQEDRYSLIKKITQNKVEVVRVIGGLLFSKPHVNGYPIITKESLKIKLEIMGFSPREIKNGFKIIRSLY